MEKFTFTFTGAHAQEVAERFAAYFWDGGLDQIIEQEVLEEFHLSLDDVKMDGTDHVVIQTDNANI